MPTKSSSIQSPTVTSNGSPPRVDKITSSRHPSSDVELPDRYNRTWSPAGIEAPVNENPRTVVSLLDTWKPADSAAPPDADDTEYPDILN